MAFFSFSWMDLTPSQLYQWPTGQPIEQVDVKLALRLFVSLPLLLFPSFHLFWVSSVHSFFSLHDRLFPSPSHGGGSQMVYR